MGLRERLAQRFYYVAQLRRHKYAQRNFEIREFWNSQATAKMKTGSKVKAARACATAAARQKFDLTSGQIRRVLNDTQYLMDETTLRRRIRELRGLRRFLAPNPLHTQCIGRYESYVTAHIQKGQTETWAQIRALNETAADFHISTSQLRRILDAYGVRRHRYK